MFVSLGAVWVGLGLANTSSSSANFKLSLAKTEPQMPNNYELPILNCAMARPFKERAKAFKQKHATNRTFARGPQNSVRFRPMRLW